MRPRRFAQIVDESALVHEDGNCYAGRAGAA